jgi:hypothetical protein
MSEILPPFLVNATMLKDVHIMVRSWIAKIYVDKQTFVVKNNCVIHNIEFFAAIEPSPMTWIPPRLKDFN